MSERLALTLRPLGELRPVEDNVKLHTEGQIESLMASIRRFGFRDPIGATPDGKIVEGHARYEAARRLGMTVVPVLTLPMESDEERRGYAIAHNQTTFNTALDQKMVAAEFDRWGVTQTDHHSLGYTPDDALFLNIGRQTQGPTNTDHNGHVRENVNAGLPQVHTTIIAFETEQQFTIWQQFIDVCRFHYNGFTIAERISQFVEESLRGD